MNYPANFERAAQRRIKQSQGMIQHTLAMVKQGRPLAAETDHARLAGRIQNKLQVSSGYAEVMSRSIEEAPPVRELLKKPFGREAIWGDTLDFVGVAFLEKGLKAAKTVGRVIYLDGRAQGSGFLISDRLFITNNHVVRSEAEAQSFCVEFDYELDVNGRPLVPTRYEIKAADFFVTDDEDDLDYTIFALGRKISGPRQMENYGYSPLSGASNKHALGEVANIVQHPDGRLKEVVLRENRLAARLDNVLHYLADTEPGASGSPVFNNEWQVIALHHYGGPHRQRVDELGKALDQQVNEGIRISAIVKELRERLPQLKAGPRALLAAALSQGEASVGPV